MDHTIKFRGKSIFGIHEWLYGSLLLLNGKSYICPDKAAAWNMTRYEVIPNTVGQFTGLLDKNRCEIYEGDILGTDIRIVGWVKGGVRGYCYDIVYVNHPTGEKRWSLYDTVVGDFKDEIEVIGNMYDNLELINS
jgi:hypothetical protein